MVDVPEPGAGIVLGLNPTLVPLGAPVADNAIELLNPATAVVVIVDVPWLPCRIVRLVGAAEIVKVGPLATVRVTVVVC